MGPSAESFHFTKWYLDGVSTAGQVMVAYWTELRWHGLHLTWHSLAQAVGGGSLQEQTSLASGTPPTWRHKTLSWEAPAFGVTLEYEPLALPYSLPLHASAEGSVLWHCELPAARVAVLRRGRPPQTMLGYGERIEFSLPPWRLPIRELRWGRWIPDSGAGSLVWIDWQGEGRPRTWLVLDGHEVPAARVLGAGVTAPNLRLKLVGPHEIRARALSDTVARIPGLSHLLPERILALRENRWMARGELQMGSRTSRWGTALFEHVILG